MQNYIMYSNGVKILYSQGQALFIYFDKLSGTVFARDKIDTIIGIKHSGIYLGRDFWGISYFLHNHYHHGTAVVDTYEGFTQKMPIGIYKEKCTRPPLEVIAEGLDQVCLKKAYSWLFYNCQSFTNQACYGVRKSDDIQKWGGLTLLVLATTLLVGLVASKN